MSVFLPQGNDSLWFFYVGLHINVIIAFENSSRLFSFFVIFRVVFKFLLLDFLKGAGRLALGGRWPTKTKSNFPKVFSRGARAARTLGWRTGFSVSARLEEWNCFPVSTSSWCSQDSSPGHQCIECRSSRCAGPSL